MSTALAPAQPPTLWELEQDLQSLLDSEDLVDESQRKEFESELAESLKASVNKRDRVAGFIFHCVAMREAIKHERKRLDERERRFDAAENRARGMVQRVIESLGPDAKGKPKKLEGNLATFSLRQAPGHIEVTDEERVPVGIKNIEVCLSLPQWQTLLRMAGIADSAVADFIPGVTQKITIDKREAKHLIEAGEEIPGVDLTIGGYCLVVK